MAPPEFGFYAGAMILTQDTTLLYTLILLPVGIVCKGEVFQPSFP